MVDKGNNIVGPFLITIIDSQMSVAILYIREQDWDAVISHIAVELLRTKIKKIPKCDFGPLQSSEQNID